MSKITSFNLVPGSIISNKYIVDTLLGAGWEGEVYLVREKKTGIRRAIKLFFPHRNVRNAAIRKSAKKLDKLKSCQILVQYHTQDEFLFEGTMISYLVSEFVAGERLSEFVARQYQKRLHPFQALHLIHTLVVGLEKIHALGEYHGDLHTDNMIVRHCGLSFDIKLFDLFDDTTFSKSENVKDDIYRVAEILYETVGGSRWYSKSPQLIKSIVLGKNRERILKKFRTISKLKTYIETTCWDD